MLLIMEKKNHKIKSLTENKNTWFLSHKSFYCIEKDGVDSNRYLGKVLMYVKVNNKRTVIQNVKNDAYIF